MMSLGSGNWTSSSPVRKSFPLAAHTVLPSILTILRKPVIRATSLQREFRERLALCRVGNLEEHDVRRSDFDVENTVDLPDSAFRLSPPISHADGDIRTTANPRGHPLALFAMPACGVVGYPALRLSQVCCASSRNSTQPSDSWLANPSASGTGRASGCIPSGYSASAS